MSVTKKYSSRTHSATNWKGDEEPQEDSGNKEPQFLKNFIYELFKYYFHMTASDMEEFAVRSTWYGNPIGF